jgi:hypothetical protein
MATTELFTSLGAYAKSRNVNKGTVYRCAQSLGIDTSDGLTSEAIAKLEAHYSILRPTQAETVQQPEETGSQIVVSGPVPDGLEVPQMPVTKLHAPSVLGETMGDPLALAHQFCGGVDAMIHQNAEYMKALDKRAEDTRLAVQLMEDAARKAAKHQREFEIQSAVKSEFLKRDTDRAMRISGVNGGA